MSTNSARGPFRRSAARYRSVFVPDTSVWIVLPTLKRLRPSRAEGIPSFLWLSLPRLLKRGRSSLPASSRRIDKW
jgi:hypothetical protein